MTLWGDLALDGARRTVTIQREYPVTASELWAELTEPGRLARWLGHCKRTPGGFRLELGSLGVQGVADGRVLACDPGRRLLITWRLRGDGQPEAETELEATIEAAGEHRAVLTVAHRRLQAVTASVYGALWQEALTRLARECGAQATPQEHDGYLGTAAGPAAFDAALAEYRRGEAALVAASIERSGDRSAVSSERLLDAPLDAVWDATTLPAPLGRWLWPVLEWPDDPARERRLRLGDVLRLGDGNIEGGVHELEVLALDERTHLRLTWGDAAVSLRLAEAGEGTLLALVQDGVKDVTTREAGSGERRLRSAPDFAAGWHTLIDRLTLVLAGQTVPAPERLWEAAYLVYSAQ